MNAAFLARIERILWFYAQPHDPRFPVICFDERPCFLIGDQVEPLALSSGKIHKDHYAFEKNGSCALLAAIEPLTGRRFAQVYERRTKREYALFFKELVPDSRTPRNSGSSRKTSIPTTPVPPTNTFPRPKPLPSPSASSLSTPRKPPVGPTRSRSNSRPSPDNASTAESRRLNDSAGKS